MKKQQEIKRYVFKITPQTHVRATQGDRILAKMGIKMGVNGLLFSNGIAYELKKADDEGRLKWFEFPNAEGYLDM